MDQPKIIAKRPDVRELKAGRYAWCACGASQDQPFCDGSHAGTAFRPHVFEMAENKTVAICQCKHTKGAPFCDGSHGGLD